MRQIGITFPAIEGEEAREVAALLKRIGYGTVIVNCLQSTALAREHCRAVTEAGLAIDHIHAPFDGINTIWAPEGDEAGDAFLQRLLDCLTCCQEFGVSKAVVHLSSGTPMPAMTESGFARLDSLMTYAEACGVTIAFENQRFLENLSTAMARYPQAGFCWDVGHEACFTDGLRFMPYFGERIICLHLHDNFGIYNQDSHLVPYEGTLDLDKAAAYLRDYGYEGPVTLECFCTDDAETAEDYFGRAFLAAVHFRAEIDG